jgi:Leucine-rich repeat (LRR) protein
VKSVIISLFLTVFSFSLKAQEVVFTHEDSTFIYHSIAEALVNPDKVFRLNLSRHKLDSFPTEILQFTNLTELDLSRNRIQQLPPGIGTLIHLKTLKLGNNKLIHLPPEIGLLKNLVLFEVNRNQLEDLPNTIGGLESLEIFQLWDNELGDVPDEIGDLKNLKILELRGILFTEEQQQRIDSIVVKSAKIYLSPSCNCKN